MPRALVTCLHCIKDIIEVCKGPEVKIAGSYKRLHCNPRPGGFLIN